MIYPILRINPDQSLLIEIYDTLEPPIPIMSFEDMGDETAESFYNLLALFINQYVAGWEEGYEAGYQNCEEDDAEGVWQ